MSNNMAIEFAEHDGHTQLVTGNWTLCFDCHLGSEFLTAITNEFDCNTELWDDKGKEFSIPQAVWCVQQVASDAEVLHFDHKPILVMVTSIEGVKKVYEVLHAMTFREAAQTAKALWHEQFPIGEMATVMSTKLATRKDMRKFVEVKGT